MATDCRTRTRRILTRTTMTERTLLDALTGSGEVTPGFPDLDQRFRLKVRSYVEICMAPAFRALAQSLDLFQMRQEGIYPIMFYLVFEPAPTPLWHGRPLQSAYEGRMYRYRPPAEGASPGAPRAERLLLDWRFALSGPRSEARAEDMSPGEGEAEIAHVGNGRIVQVLTRPLAPPGERDVRELPEKYRLLRERPWEGPYPTWQLMAHVPEGFSGPAGQVPPHESVWGVPNTDINQHVNLNEYIADVENHQQRLLSAAGIAPADHAVTRAEIIFHKPFFAGEAYRVEGDLRRRDGETLFLGGIYQAGAPSAPEGRPGVFMRLEGRLEGRLECDGE